MTMSLSAHCHLLHLKKNKKMTMNQRGSSSFATPKKKNKEMMTSQGGSLSIATPEKEINDDELKRLAVICYT